MNLLDELRDNIGYNLSKHTANFLQEEEVNTSAGINSTFSTILAGLIEKGSTKKGANEIFKAVEKQDVSIVDHVERIFTRSPQTVNGLSNIGTRELPKFLGTNQREAGNLIAEKSGMKRNSTSKLMKISTPFLMGILGKKVAADNLDADGLMSLINSQKSAVESNLPSGMTDVLELKSFGWVKKEKVEVVEEKKPKREKAPKKERVAKVKEEVIETPIVQEAAATGMGWLRWLLPLLLLGAILFYLIFRSGCAGTAENAVSTVASTTKNVVKESTEVVTNTLGAVNDAALKTLDNIKFAAGSAGSQMMEFIKGGAKGDGRFRFNNLNFASGSAVIDGESGLEVDNLSSILKAYTDVNVMIEGYTDSRGNADSNLNLSQQRADAVRSRLITEGIAENRITTKGFGDANPIGDNETAEGRAQNRRIEVVIAK